MVSMLTRSVNILTRPACKLADMGVRNSSRIKEARKRAGMTQRELARIVGVSRPAVSQWESGDTKSLKGENLLKAAEALRVAPEDLVGGRPRVEEERAMYGDQRDELTAEAVEFAAIFQRLPRERRAHWRETLFVELAVRDLFPYLRIGKPDAKSYNEFVRMLESERRTRGRKENTS